MKTHLKSMLSNLINSNDSAASADLHSHITEKLRNTLSSNLAEATEEGENAIVAGLKEQVAYLFLTDCADTAWFAEKELKRRASGDDEDEDEDDGDSDIELEDLHKGLTKLAFPAGTIAKHAEQLKKLRVRDNTIKNAEEYMVSDGKTDPSAHFQIYKFDAPTPEIRKFVKLLKDADDGASIKLINGPITVKELAKYLKSSDF